MPGVLAMLDNEYSRLNKIAPITTTIRPMRKNLIKKGDTLFLYAGLRSKHVKRLGTVICAKNDSIEIKGDELNDYSLIINGIFLKGDEEYKIAKRNGFFSSRRMVEWFRKTYGLPFHGQLIYMTNSYNRKYYLHKKTKDLDLKVKLGKCEKTIEITSEQAELVKKNKYVNELQCKYNYGVQFINPLFE